ncbi:hypothetical protein L1887_61875 [Cichorium endivia]|nr:hypothetical protein L1887_61875 [Cichorium endivia]
MFRPEPVVVMNAAGRAFACRLTRSPRRGSRLVQDGCTTRQSGLVKAAECMRAVAGGCSFGFFAWRLRSCGCVAERRMDRAYWCGGAEHPRMRLSGARSYGCADPSPSAGSSLIRARRFEPARILEVRLLLEVHSSPVRLEHRKAEMAWSIA